MCKIKKRMGASRRDFDRPQGLEAAAEEYQVGDVLATQDLQPGRVLLNALGAEVVIRQNEHGRDHGATHKRQLGDTAPLEVDHLNILQPCVIKVGRQLVDNP